MQLRTGLPIVGLCCACGAEGGWGDSGYYGGESLNVYNEDGEIVDVEDDCEGAEAKPLYLSPDDSNSTASPVLVREFAGQAPVRSWEFLNYYTFDYAPAPKGSVSVDLQLRPTDDPLLYDFQIGLASEAMSAQDRPPMNLVFSIDGSGSMSGKPTALVKDSLRSIASVLEAGDVVSAVSWSSSSNVLLREREVDGPDDPEVLSMIAGLGSSGSTDLSGGLQKAYELASDRYDPARINRVILLSDGGANVGETDADLIGSHAEDADGAGIYMVGVGIGGGSYNDGLMDTVTDLGKGASLFIPNTNESTKMLANRFVSTVGVAARDVQVELDLPAELTVVQFSGEEKSTNKAEVEPQHLAPNDAMVFYHQLEACEAKAISDDLAIRVVATWTDPVTLEERTAETSATIGELLAGPDRQLRKGAATYWTAKSLYDVGDSTERSHAESALEAARKAAPDDAELDELSAMLD
jgi:Ca-activated chloride channel family protein